METNGRHVGIQGTLACHPPTPTEGRALHSPTGIINLDPATSCLENRSPWLADPPTRFAAKGMVVSNYHISQPPQGCSLFTAPQSIRAVRGYSCMRPSWDLATPSPWPNPPSLRSTSSSVSHAPKRRNSRPLSPLTPPLLLPLPDPRHTLAAAMRSLRTWSCSTLFPLWIRAPSETLCPAFFLASTLVI